MNTLGKEIEKRSGKWRFFLLTLLLFGCVIALFTFCEKRVGSSGIDMPLVGRGSTSDSERDAGTGSLSGTGVDP